MDWHVAQVLRVVDEHPDLTADRLGELLDRPKMAVQEALAALERDGLVSRWDEGYVVTSTTWDAG